jgi:zinc transporter 2
MVICLSFMVVEIIYGIIAQSLAILTDAADLFSDSAGFIINIAALHYAKKKANTSFTFGYLKVEALGAMASIILIWVLYGLLIEESI